MNSVVLEGNCFIITTSDLLGTSSAEIPRVLLRNPSNSDKKIFIFRVEEQCNTSTGNAMYRYYKRPTVTSEGTPLTINNLSIGNSATSVSLAYLNPTASLYGTKLMNTIVSQMSTLVRERSSPLLVLYPGEDLLINVRANSGTTTWCINLYWKEEQSR
jgi:hypothetical protein